MEIKIFEIQECDYVAAKNWKDAIREWASTTNNARREAIGEIRQLSDRELDKYKFVEDVYGSQKPKRSFRKQLAKMIAEGERFPAFFCTSKY